MHPESSGEITGLLKAWSAGNQSALERLAPLVYDELRRRARGYMARERQENSLQATALVNEAFLRLVEVEGLDWHDRAHFFAVSAQMMRRILVDAARARCSEKRGGRVVKVDLNESINAVPVWGTELIDLDEALEALAQFDSRKAKVVEMRFFGGLSVEETAEVLKISAQSVMRDWKLARAWLIREMEK
jgi:RNA polymerase sigma-70 factor, ECF subfamily